MALLLHPPRRPLKYTHCPVRTHTHTRAGAHTDTHTLHLSRVLNTPPSSPKKLPFPCHTSMSSHRPSAKVSTHSLLCQTHREAVVCKEGPCVFTLRPCACVGGEKDSPQRADSSRAVLDPASVNKPLEKRESRPRARSFWDFIPLPLRALSRLAFTHS